MPAILSLFRVTDNFEMVMKVINGLVLPYKAVQRLPDDRDVRPVPVLAWGTGGPWLSWHRMREDG